MATSTAQVDGWVYEMTSEPIDVTSMLPYLDPKWRFTDANGHEHTTEPQTYVWVQDEPDYVMVDEDGYPEEYPGQGHYECPICHEHLEPALTTDTTRRFIPGPVFASITSPEGIAASVNPDQITAFHGLRSDDERRAFFVDLIGR